MPFGREQGFISYRILRSKIYRFGCRAKYRIAKQYIAKEHYPKKSFSSLLWVVLSYTVINTGFVRYFPLLFIEFFIYSTVSREVFRFYCGVVSF